MLASEQKKQRPYPVYRTHAARRRLRWLIAIGVVTFVVVAAIAVAGSSYWWFSAKVGDANSRVEEGVQQALAAKPSTTLVPPEQVQQSDEAVNIVLVGSDTRGSVLDSSGRSDTLMVIHLDPSLNFASVLSIPRDLYVDIPGHPKNRINAAYAFGGPELTITTVKNVFGLDITKYVEMDFRAFQQIVDGLGGVYVDIDQHYEGPTPGTDLHPGYQLLSGADALTFARFRHDQNADWGRQTRQQRVISAIREQAMGWNLPVKLPGLVSATLDSVATNLSANEILRLASWLVRLDGSRIRQIQIKASGEMIRGASVLVADEASLKDAVTKLLDAPGTESDKAASTETSMMLASTGSNLVALAPNTTPTAEAAALPNKEMWRSAQSSVPFALEAPQYIPDGFSYAAKMPTGEGTYQIDPGGNAKPAVRMLYRYKGRDLYLGVSATTWADAPLASKGTELEANGVKYTIVGTNGKADHIWWKSNGVLYFISNTLMYTVSQDDLLAMAKSMTPVESSK